MARGAPEASPGAGLLEREDDMPFVRSLASVVVGRDFARGSLLERSQAQRRADAQVCSLGSAAVGQPGTLICKDVQSGATTQTIPLGPTVSAAGGIAASLASRGDRVLVTNQASGAFLFRAGNGFLREPVLLETDGEGSLSGALGDRGAYVLTGTTLRFFPHGQTTAGSARRCWSAMVRRRRSRSRIASPTSPRRTARSRRSRLATTAAWRRGVAGRGRIARRDRRNHRPRASWWWPPSRTWRATPTRRRSRSRRARPGPAGPHEGGRGLLGRQRRRRGLRHQPGQHDGVLRPHGGDGFLSYTSAAASLPGESVFDLDMWQGLVVRAGRARRRAGSADLPPNGGRLPRADRRGPGGNAARGGRAAAACDLPLGKH